jgi:uncharacterized protein involved in exopolysaccharide biosynthesis
LWAFSACGCIPQKVTASETVYLRLKNAILERDRDRCRLCTTGGIAMSTASFRQQPDAAASEDAGNLIDIQQLIDSAGFTLRAVERHRMIAATVFAVTLTVAGALLAVWPRTYHAQATLLARRNDLMTSLSNPSRPARPEADDPTRAAFEMIHDRENMLMLIRQTDLLNAWEQNRSRLSRLKERVLGIYRKPTEADRIDALLWMLDQRLWVTVDKEGVVKIGIEWPNPKTAAALVQAAVQNFVEKRHETETAAIGESISILQESAASLQADVDRTIAQLRDEQAKRPPTTDRRASRAPAATAPHTALAARPVEPVPAAASDAIVQLAQMKEALDAMRQQIKKIEAARQQQLSDLQAKLDAARAVYTEDHPTVAALRQSMAATLRDPAELATLRAEAQHLEKQYDALATATQAESPTASSKALAAVVQLPGPTPKADTRVVDDDPPPMFAILPADVRQLTDLVHPASRLLTLQLSQLANLLDRINAARLELATSGAGLKFRYVVTRPPEVPKHASKPKVLPVLVAALLASVFLAVATAVAIDVAGGRVLESWQIERRVGIPVLGVLEPVR